MPRARLRIEGMDCASCTKLLENALTDEPGVQSVAANYMLDVAVVDFDPSLTDIMRVLGAITAKTSYRARIIK